jgi:hypothetical protein
LGINHSLANHKRQANNCVIDNNLQQIIDGLLLSDAWMMSNSIFSAEFRISSKHDDIPKYLLKEFSKRDIKCSHTSRNRHDKRTNKVYHCEEFRTRAYVQFKKIRDKWYKDGYKEPPTTLKLTPIVLYLWYVGDGCKITERNGKNAIILCTDSFSDSSIELLREKLISLFSKKNVTISKSQYSRIRIGIKLFTNFLEECKKSRINLPSYEYKF